MAITAAEQYLLELINRARLDPLAEAARLGVGLNQDLAPGTIGAQAQQVLAHDPRLETSAQNHSTWMLAADVFSHTGAGGSTATQRMQDAGYLFAGSWRSGENIAFSGTTGTLNLQSAITQHYTGLFNSAGHRANTLNASFSEIGLAQVSGQFTSGGNSFNTSMLTENFAASRTPVYITGVAYQDRDYDKFYSMGEGRADIWVGADSARISTAAAGGYRVGVDADATTQVSIGQGSNTLATLAIDMSRGNVKLDVVTSATGQFSLDLSGSAVLISGIGNARLLGNADLNLTGTTAYNRLIGNSGVNTLSDGGGSGADMLAGMGGNDRYIIRNAGTQIIENSGQGSADQVFAGVSFALAADDNIEILRTTHMAGAIALTGNALDQQIAGNASANVLAGLGGTDRLYGGAGGDLLFGGTGTDRLWGDAGNDILNGDEGNDRLDGGAGRDTLRGGIGADSFVFSGVLAGADRILDFTDNVDTLILTADLWGGARWSIAQVMSRATLNNGHVVFDFGHGNSLIIDGLPYLSALADDLVVVWG